MYIILLKEIKMGNQIFKNTQDITFLQELDKYFKWILKPNINHSKNKKLNYNNHHLNSINNKNHLKYINQGSQID